MAFSRVRRLKACTSDSRDSMAARYSSNVATALFRPSRISEARLIAEFKATLPTPAARETVHQTRLGLESVFLLEKTGGKSGDFLGKN